MATWPEVQSATRDQQRLHITASHAETVVQQLLAADEDLEELEVRRAGLAEAFTEAHSGGSVMNGTQTAASVTPARSLEAGIVRSADMPAARLWRALCPRKAEALYSCGA